MPEKKVPKLIAVLKVIINVSLYKRHFIELFFYKKHSNKNTLKAKFIK